MNHDIKQRMYEKLVDAFIVYQHRLTNPWPTQTETHASLVLKYRNDVVFHYQVDSLVSGVMLIISKELDEAVKDE